jgi:hypothetical protein
MDQIALAHDREGWLELVMNLRCYIIYRVFLD